MDDRLRSVDTSGGDRAPSSVAERGAVGLAALVLVAAVVMAGGNLFGDSEASTPSTTPLAHTTPRATLLPTQNPALHVDMTGEKDRSGGLGVGTHQTTVEGRPFWFGVPAGGWEWFRGQYLSKSTRGSQGAEAVIFWATYPTSQFADLCPQVLSASRATTVTGLAGALSAVRGTTTTESGDGTVGGRPAKRVRLVVLDDVGCDPGFFYTYPFVYGGAFWAATGPGDTITVWIVDLDGTIVFIEAETQPDAGSAVDRQIEQIIASIRFDPPTMEEYIAAVDEICTAGNERWMEAMAPFEPFDGPIEGYATLSDAAEGSTVQLVLADEVMAELRAYPAPEADSADIEELLALLEPPIDSLRQVASAVSAGDAARVQVLLRDHVALIQLKDAAVAAHPLQPLGSHLRSCAVAWGRG